MLILPPGEVNNILTDYITINNISANLPEIVITTNNIKQQVEQNIPSTYITEQQFYAYAATKQYVDNLINSIDAVLDEIIVGSNAIEANALLDDMINQN